MPASPGSPSGPSPAPAAGRGRTLARVGLGLIWGLAAISLLAPLAGERSTEILQGALLAAAVGGLGFAIGGGRRWPALTWCGATAVAGGRLAFGSVHDQPDPVLTLFFAAMVQALALVTLAGAPPGWRAQAMALAALFGPFALIALVFWPQIPGHPLLAAAAVALDLAALPLAAAAGRAPRPRQA